MNPAGTYEVIAGSHSVRGADGGLTRVVVGDRVQLTEAQANGVMVRSIKLLEADPVPEPVPTPAPEQVPVEMEPEPEPEPPVLVPTPT